MKVGDLLSYTYYGLHGTSEHFGLFLRKATIVEQNGDWGDIIVLADGREQQWTSWQCEVISAQDGITMEDRKCPGDISST